MVGTIKETKMAIENEMEDLKEIKDAMQKANLHSQ